MYVVKGCYVLLFDFACRHGEFFYLFFSAMGKFLCMFVQHSTPMTASNLYFRGNSEL